MGIDNRTSHVIVYTLCAIALGLVVYVCTTAAFRLSQDPQIITLTSSIVVGLLGLLADPRAGKKESVIVDNPPENPIPVEEKK